MKQHTLSKWLKIIVAGMALCGFVIFGGLAPKLVSGMLEQNPDWGGCSSIFIFFAWVGFIWLAALPCYWVLGIVWKIAGEIKADRSFTIENSLRVKKIMNDPNNAISKTLHYDFEENVIRVSVEEESVEFKWENIFQMKTSGNLLLIYTNRINAYILPLAQVGDKYDALSALAHSKLEKYRIKA